MTVMGHTCNHLEQSSRQKKKQNQNDRSPSVALLCAGLLRRGMVYELERVLRVCDGFLCSMSVTYDGAVLLWQW